MRWLLASRTAARLSSKTLARTEVEIEAGISKALGPAVLAQLTDCVDGETRMMADDRYHLVVGLRIRKIQRRIHAMEVIRPLVWRLLHRLIRTVGQSTSPQIGQAKANTEE